MIQSKTPVGCFPAGVLTWGSVLDALTFTEPLDADAIFRRLELRIAGDQCGILPDRQRSREGICIGKGAAGLDLCSEQGQAPVGVHDLQGCGIERPKDLVGSVLAPSTLHDVEHFAHVSWSISRGILGAMTVPAVKPLAMSSPAPTDVLTEAVFVEAISALTGSVPELASVIDRWGTPPFWTHESGFGGLVLAILSQQVSLESAEAALAKLERRIETVTPERSLALDDASLREIGFSRQKAVYVRGLAEAILNGGLDLQVVGRMADDEVRDTLMGVKGIGPWTADTYLLFSLRRPDAWPSGDLALAKATQDLRGLASIPSYPELDRIAEGWRPWRAVAARILWHHYLSVRGRG